MTAKPIKPLHIREHRQFIAGVHRFDLDGPWRIVRHEGTDDWQLICTLKGRGKILHPSGSCAIGLGGLALWSPGQFQDYADADDAGWTYAWIHFLPPPAWRSLLDWPRSGQGPGMIQVDDPDAAAAIAARCQHVIQLAIGGGRRSAERTLNALEDVLLQAEAWNPQAGQPPDLAIERVCKEISAYPARPWRLDGLARLAGLSRAQFTRRFRANCSCSPLAYLETVRLSRAAYLLASGECTVGAVADQLGFCSPYHFSARFRSCYGVAPSAWGEHVRGSTAALR